MLVLIIVKKIVLTIKIINKALYIELYIKLLVFLTIKVCFIKILNINCIVKLKILLKNVLL